MLKRMVSMLAVKRDQPYSQVMNVGKKNKPLMLLLAATDVR